MQLERYLIERSIKEASGTQTFYVDAVSIADAIERHKNGQGDIYSNDCEVTQLGKPYFTNKVPINDDGDYDDSKDVVEIQAILDWLKRKAPHLQNEFQREFIGSVFKFPSLQFTKI